MTVNVIDDSMLPQVDEELHHYQVLREISDHSADGNSLNRSDGFIRSLGSNLHSKKTNRIWGLEVEWKDGTLIWISFKDIKNSNPVELAEYVVANNIEDKPAFKWWVEDIVYKQDQIISKFKAKYWRTTNQFWVQVPKTDDEAYKIDQQTGTLFWIKAIEKEMSNVCVSFGVLKGVTPYHMIEGKVEPGFKYVGTHMVFDIKVNCKFTCRDRLVSGRRKTAPSLSIARSSAMIT